MVKQGSTIESFYEFYKPFQVPMKIDIQMYLRFVVITPKGIKHSIEESSQYRLGFENLMILGDTQMEDRCPGNSPKA